MFLPLVLKGSSHAFVSARLSKYQRGHRQTLNQPLKWKILEVANKFILEWANHSKM